MTDLKLPEPAFNIECNDEPTLPVFTENQMRAYAQEAARQEREAAINYFMKVAGETQDKSPQGKAFWCREAAMALFDEWRGRHSPNQLRPQDKR